MDEGEHGRRNSGSNLRRAISTDKEARMNETGTVGSWRHVDGFMPRDIQDKRCGVIRN